MQRPAKPDTPDAFPSPGNGRWWAAPLPWLILTAGLLLSVTGAVALRNKIQTATADRFQALIQQQEIQLVARLTAHIQILRGAQGLWRSGAGVDRDRWRRYVETLALERSFPGIQGVGYAAVIQPGALAAFERAIRAEAPSQPPVLQALFEGFAVRPAGPRPLYTAIQFLEPFVDRNIRPFGYDMLSEPVRRAAMERARDTGEPALSGRVRLLQETETDVQPGFLVYLPLYRGLPQTVEQRREQIVGYVYSPFRAHDFMQNAIASRGQYVQYAIFDGNSVRDEDLLFRSRQPEPPPAATPFVHLIELAGRTWTTVSQPGPLLNTGADRAIAMLFGGAGTLIAMLMAGLTLAWLRTRERAARLALKMTADLRQREIDLERLSGQLRQSNEDLQQFAYAASHDLKEPLRSIAGSLGLLSRRLVGLDPDAREFLGYANDGARRMSGLIDSLLDYSRVHTQAAPLEPVDLDEALDTALRDIAALVTDSQARIERQPLPRVLADRAQIIRVLRNLIENAIKFSRRHAPVPIVTIAAKREGDSWAIGVTDNGIGIAPEHQKKIFVMFKRLHTRQEYEGSGLGLALCKRIVQRHGGRIWLRSEAGHGASFFFTLHAADGVPAQAQPGRSPPAPPPAQTVH